MRLLLAFVMVGVCAGPVMADAQKAVTANAKGYALHKKKKYAEAAVEYRKAIAEDPSHLLAHYNLACVASLTQDHDTAVEALRWIADRSTWDKAAAGVMTKAGKDKELTWIRGQQGLGSELAGGMKNMSLAIANLIDRSDTPIFAGKETTEAKALKAMAGTSGKHEEKCNTKTFSTSADSMKGITFGANLRDGLVAFDDKGASIAHTDALGCASPRDTMHALNQAEAVAGVQRLFVVQYSKRTEMNVTIFALIEKRFVRVFDAELMNFDGTGTLQQTPLLYNLVFTPPGKQKPIVYRWDEASTKYVPESQ